jgi:hypothetical protein
VRVLRFRRGRLGRDEAGERDGHERVGDVYARQWRLNGPRHVVQCQGLQTRHHGLAAWLTRGGCLTRRLRVVMVGTGLVMSHTRHRASGFRMGVLRAHQLTSHHGWERHGECENEGKDLAKHTGTYTCVRKIRSASTSKVNKNHGLASLLFRDRQSTLPCHHPRPSTDVEIQATHGYSFRTQYNRCAM